MKRTPRLLTASVLAASTLLLPTAARADEVERESTGVLVRVDISPLECLQNCGGGDLPATGAEAPSLLVWVALALVAGGIALFFARRVRASAPVVRVSTASSPYDVHSGRRAEIANEGRPSSSNASAPSPGGDAVGRQIE